MFKTIICQTCTWLHVVYNKKLLSRSRSESSSPFTALIIFSFWSLTQSFIPLQGLIILIRIRLLAVAHCYWAFQCIFAKCTRLACLLSFASLFKLYIGINCIHLFWWSEKVFTVDKSLKGRRIQIVCSGGFQTFVFNISSSSSSFWHLCVAAQLKQMCVVWIQTWVLSIFVGKVVDFKRLLWF